jgi:H+/Cl- antiporter ClcA
MEDARNRIHGYTEVAKYKTFFILLAKWILWGTIIGAAAGTMASLLLNVNDFLTSVREANPWLLFLLPLGGLVIGYLYTRFSKESAKGNDLIYEHVQHGQGTIPLLLGPIVFLSTFITHLFGGSTGREGAAIQMGASIAGIVNRVFKLGTLDRRILIMSGISGGFGSAFGTPLAGTVFGMEVIAIGRMQYEALVPCFIASFVGHFVTTAWGVQHEQHVIAAIPTIGTVNIMKVILVSVIFGLTSVLYSQLRHEVKALSKKYLNNLMLRAFVGGLVIIALVFIVGSRDYLGRGLPMVDQAFTAPVPPLAFLAKIVFTAVTMGSGFRGGEVIPLFFIGATMGNTLAPIINLPLSFLAAIGMIAVFCGAANTPLSVFIMSIELFEGEAVFYFFLACIISFIFSGHHGIYGAQKIYEPKSRMFNIPDGKRITFVEETKRGENKDEEIKDEL